MIAWLEEHAMTITLSIDPETERLARRLAEVTGKSLPDILKQAIEAEAAKAGIDHRPRLPRDELLARMIEITNGFDKLPVLDPRSADEIIGYDEHGLPT
jgi:antitoxin VapB